jgi:phosphatidylethanolamine/phosphatidyl-N-methylethanolamine N-methyltransferase
VSAPDRSFWERHAARYDLSLRVLGKPMPRMVELASEAVRGLHVLEVAAGTGIVTVGLARSARSVVATDYADGMIRLLKRRLEEAALSQVRIEQADLYRLPFADATFDAVVAANVLHLVADLDAALASLRRVLKSRGRLIVPTFVHDETPLSWTLSRLLALTGFPGSRRFSVRSLEHTLAERGLQIERAETIPGVIPIHYVEGSATR